MHRRFKRVTAKRGLRKKVSQVDRIGWLKGQGKVREGKDKKKVSRMKSNKKKKSYLKCAKKVRKRLQEE